jgi:hypothetical protein
VPSSPGRKSKIGEALDRRIGKPGENRGQIVAYGDVDATTGFDGGEDGSDFGSGWLTQCRQWPSGRRLTSVKFICSGNLMRLKDLVVHDG